MPNLHPPSKMHSVRMPFLLRPVLKPYSSSRDFLLPLEFAIDFHSYKIAEFLEKIQYVLSNGTFPFDFGVKWYF